MRTIALFSLATAFLASTATATVAITGVQDGTTGIRREIRDLQQNHPNQWNLYLLGMQDFQKTATSSPSSFFQISGIHGLPSVAYDGVQANQQALSQGAVGYCPHSSPLFPVWHRAYVALYEQSWYASVLKVANSFTGADKATYVAAAKGMRLPYWEWAHKPANDWVTASALINPTVSVHTPSGQQTIANPIYSYKMQVLNQADTEGAPWNEWPNTLRYPTTNNAAAKSDEMDIVNGIGANLANLRSSIYNVMYKCPNWLEFADDSASSSSAGCSTSLESIHDNIHNIVGGGGAGGIGHMTDLSHAGFDPIFFLHHTNVDRLFALWQVMNPNGWLGTASSGPPTYSLEAGHTVNGISYLRPFHKDTQGTFWTVNGVRSISTFHYTYVDMGNKAQVSANINSLYGPAGSSASKRSISERGDSDGSSPSSTIKGLSHMSLHHKSGGSSTTPAGIFPPAGAAYPSGTASPTGISKPSNSSMNTHDYSCNIVTERMGLGGSYTVYVFFGAVPSDSSTWFVAPNLVGSQGILGATSMPKRNGWLVAGAVSLTTALQDAYKAGHLRSLAKSDVTPYLKEHMNWSVKTAAGQVVPNNEVPGLAVSVASTNVMPALSSGGTPSYGQAEIVNQITHGKAGGLQEGMPHDFWSVCKPISTS
ncbi:MAG: hypothetical protein M1828_001729 [Chrysothrix sp. TS-e1954]|nr:MAG: hypothetical protein M1828_001729 [Chrysothrix sp. TS-e1954]